MKKLLLFLLTLLMVFSMVGCKPKEPVIEEPQVVALTEEQAIEFVKGLPLYVVNLEKEPIYLSNENAYHNINFILELANISVEDVFIEGTLDVQGRGMGEADVETIQKRVDEVFVKQYNISELFKDFIEEGKLIAPVFLGEHLLDENYKWNRADHIFEIYEATEDYIIVKRLAPITLTYLEDNSEYDYSSAAFYVVVLTDNGPRLYSWDSFAVEVREEPSLELPVVEQ